ncbi:MAG: E3 ubiquitin-protein ligase huwe1 [Paramarteilia canceri]
MTEDYALFKLSSGLHTYHINPSSWVNAHHLSYFKFIGRLIGRAIFDKKLLDCCFTRSFYKQMLGKPVNFEDLENEDYDFYKGLKFLLDNSVDDIGADITFSHQISEFGESKTVELKPNGFEILVTDDNKQEYTQLMSKMRLFTQIKDQLNNFLQGFYEVLPKDLISIFNEQELEFLISGLPEYNIDDLRANTEYVGYNSRSIQVVWLFDALKSFDDTLKAQFIQFVTGSSRIPVQGFSHLQGMNGIQKFTVIIT